MSKPPKAAPRELPDEGTHSAVCVGFIDIGTQKSEKFGDRHQCLLRFELVDLSTKEKPVVMSRTMTYSGNAKSTLAKTLKAWLGVKDAGEFEMENLLGKPGIVTIEHSETEKGNFANITNISAVRKGEKLKKPVSELKSLFLDDSYDAEVFESLPEWVQNKILDSDEYTEVSKPKGKSKKGK